MAEVQHNDVFAKNEKAMELIFTLIDSQIVVTPTLLQELDMSDVDNALDIIHEHLRTNSEGNPIHEMQSVVTAKLSLDGYRPKNQIVEDIDFF